MFEKIKNNYKNITLVLSLAAIILCIARFINIITAQIDQNAIINFIEIGLVITSAVLLLAFTFVDNAKKFLPLIFTVFISSFIIDCFYAVLQFNTWASLVYLVIYTAALVLFFVDLFMTNNYIKLVFISLLVVIASLLLLNVFTGSILSFAELIIIVLIIFTKCLKRGE